MSEINVKPYIESLLESLEPSDLNTLKNLVNGGEANSEPTYLTLDRGSSYTLLSEDNMGISYVVLEINEVRAERKYEGYLIYTDSVCTLLYFTGKKNQNIGIMVIDPDALTCEFVSVPFTILELRSELNDCLASGGGMKLYMHFMRVITNNSRTYQMALISKRATAYVNLSDFPYSTRIGQNDGPQTEIISVFAITDFSTGRGFYLADPLDLVYDGIDVQFTLEGTEKRYERITSISSDDVLEI